ncbi:MAG: gamma-glutamyltransferase [Pseudomonadales bacterium]|nr:gamma-glutamyltransferase [Pseudomonadales bacterium]
MKFAIFLLSLLTVPLFAASPDITFGQQAMVTSRSSHASKVGHDILKAGGNAVDAAVATAFALAVTYPSAGNIGGGGFAVIRLPGGEVITLDHRETAPASAHRDMYLDANGQVIKGLSTASHKAAGVPGSVDGLLVLLERYGSMSRQQVMQPAIDLATRGFALSYDLAQQMGRRLKSMAKYPASMAKFSDNGKPFKAGDIWRQADLARSLQLISDQGRDGFYKGRTAELIVREMQRSKGDITAKDLAGYQSVWRPAVRGDYRGYEIYGMGPPSSGGTLVIQILNMLEDFDLAAMGFGSASAVHLMVEAERRAYADRAEHLGDPDFYAVPLKMLLNKKYAQSRMSDYDPATASLSKDIGAGAPWPPESPETTHLSVFKGGMMVALTTTLNSGYGSKIVVPGTGILLNNEMNDFSIKENVPNLYNVIGRKANAIRGGKRMLSSMAPTLVLRAGKPFLIVGSPGGSGIITTTLQVIVNMIDHGMSVDEAVSLSRFHHQWQPDSIYYEKHGLSPDTRLILEKMGHIGFRELDYGLFLFGDANAIHIQGETVIGIKDPRNEGAALGY